MSWSRGCSQAAVRSVAHWSRLQHNTTPAAHRHRRTSLDESKPPRGTAGGIEYSELALFSVDRGVLAYSTLHTVAATPLEPEVEQRLQALLVDRMTPLLLQCLQMWEGGAQRLMSCVDAGSGRGRWLGFRACCQAWACHWSSWLLPSSCAAGIHLNACQRGGVPWCPPLYRSR
jgi:hypothetical protein